MNSGSTGHDVTERLFFDLSPDLLCIADLDGRFTHLNASFERTLGWTDADLIGKPFLEIVHPDDREAAGRTMEGLRGNSVTAGFENRCLCKGGGSKWISWSAHLAADGPSIYAIGRDITGLKAVEAELRRSERMYRYLLEVANEGVMAIDASSAITFVNERFLNMLGYRPEEVIGEQILNFVDPQDVPFVLERIGRRMRGVEEQYDVRLVRKDGQRIVTMINAAPMHDDEKRYIGSLSLITDVTEKRRMESALMEEKERLRVTLRSIGDGVIVTDDVGRVVLMNDVAETLTGWKQEEAMSQPLEKVFNIINEVTGARCENPAEKVLREGRIVGLANHTILIAKDGTRRVLGDSGAPIRDDKGKTLGVVLVFRDETGIRQMETEMAKMQRLESIGVLAGGIAHDFNNYLTAIEGNIALAKMKLGPGNKAVVDRLSDAEKASVMARSLTKQLLVFSKGGEPVKKMSDIGMLLADSLRITLAGSNVNHSLDIDPDLCPVEVDEGQIGQVFNNIILNAKDAMPGGGTIKVSAKNVNLKPDEVRSCSAGDYISISITDHGSGIPASDIEKVFDPYFSTKTGGRGLGLAIVHSIMARHDGAVQISSEVGRGTTVTLYLPVPYEYAKPTEERVEAMRQGHGRVLWMDDEDMIREVGSELLEYLGYQVKVARDGEEALEMYLSSKNSNEPFDIVILDLTVPGGMGGEEAMRRLLEMDPGVKAMVCSGYSNDPVMARYYDYGFRGVLPKPFNIEDLSAKLLSIIGSSA